MLKKSRKIQKYLLFGLLSLLLMICFLSSILNALVLDLIKGAVKGREYRNYMVTCGTVNGNLLSGFLIRDIKILTVENQEPVADLDSLYVRINPLDLIQRRLTIVQSKLNELEIHVKNLDDFFTNLVALFGNETRGDVGGALKWFDSISCSDLTFYNLQLRNPLELLFTNREILNKYDLRINERIRFEGMLEWDSRNLRLKAIAKDLQTGLYGEILPLSLELQFDLQNYGGELAVVSEGTPLSRLATMKGLIYDGSVTMESRLRFSQYSDVLGIGAKKAQIKDGKVMYYSLKGEGRLFSSSVEFGSLKLQDLYLRAEWTQDNFELKHSQSIFLGSHVGLSYSYDPITSHNYAVNFNDLDVQRLFKLLKFEQLSQDLNGEVSFGLRGNLSRIEFTPLIIKSLSYLKTPLYLKNIEIEPIKPDFFAEDFKLTFESRGGSYMGAFVDKVRGFLDREKLTFSMSCDGVDIRDIEPLKRRSNTLGVNGRANVMFGGQIRFSEKDYVLSATGDFFEVEIAGLPVESLNFNYNKKAGRNLWTWQMKLPLNDGYFDFQMDFLKQKGSIKLEAKDFDLAYFKQRIEDFPLTGKVNADVRVDFEPELTVKVSAKSDKLKLFEIPMVKSFLEVYLKKNKLQFKLKDESLYALIHGEHRLFDLMNSKGTQKIQDLIGNFRFEFEESKLKRYLQLPYFNRLDFNAGEIVVSGNYKNVDQSIRVKLKKLALESDQTNLDFRFSETLKWDQINKLNGAFELWAQDGLNNTAHKMASFNSYGQEMRIQLSKFRLSLLRQFSKDKYPLPFHGVVDLDVNLQDTFVSPRFEADFNASPLFLDLDGKNTYLERMTGKILLNPDGFEARNTVLVREGSEFIINGYLPLRLDLDSRKFKVLEDGKMDLQLQLPETPLEVFKDLIPVPRPDFAGDVALDIKIQGTPDSPFVTGNGEVLFEYLRFPDSPQKLGLNQGSLDIAFMGDYIKVNKLQGRLGELIFYLRGEVFPLEDFKFFLKGDMAQPKFDYWFMRLQDARLSEVLINGSGSQLQASASLSAKKASVSYEELMGWIARDSAPLKIPYFPDYDFELEIKKPKNVEFNGELFRMKIEPNFKLRLRPQKSYLDGFISAKEGVLDIARNDFKIEPDSIIRFVPREQSMKLAVSSNHIGSSIPVWTSSKFHMKSVSDKLQTMWESGYLADDAISGKSAWYDGDKSFDTYLNLRGTTDIGDRRVSIVLNGPLGTLDYSLDSDDENLGKAEILRLLASRGVGVRNTSMALSRDEFGENTYRLDSRDDERILSGQISATLEDEVLGRPVENLLGSLFDFQSLSLEPNFLGNHGGLGRLKMNTRLSKDITLSHELENMEFRKKRETRLELKLDEELGLIFKREQKIDRDFDLFKGESEKDFQFGFERRLKF